MTPPSSRTSTPQAATIISTVRRSRLFCAFLTSATRALRAAVSVRADVGRPEPAAGRAEVGPGEAAERFEGLVGGFLATVSFGRGAGA
jgi:hypothetical protein